MKPVLSLAIIVLGGGPVVAQFKSLPATPFHAAAVVVDGVPLLHTEQFFGANLWEALDKLMANVRDHGGDPSRIAKVNIVSTDREIAVHSMTGIVSIQPMGKPATSFASGGLADPKAKVGIDAVVVSRLRNPYPGTLRPGPRVYVSGQAEKGATTAEAAKNTLASLKKTLDWLGCKPEDVVQCKSFLKPITAAEEVKKEFEAMFGKDKVPPLVFVEWDSTLPIEIELIANAPKPKDANPPAIEFLTPPGMTASPVYCRVARVNAPETIYLSGLYSENPGTGTEEVESVFAQLQDTLKKSGSDLKHLAKATYYVSGDDASNQLNLLRPKFYDPKRPPAASKAMVSGVGRKDRTITFDMIAVKAR